MTYHEKYSYLFSQEAVSMSMLCDRDKLWDWVSRLLEGELERELTPSLLWLPYATPARAKDHHLTVWNRFSIVGLASKPSHKKRYISSSSSSNAALYLTKCSRPATVSFQQGQGWSNAAAISAVVITMYDCFLTLKYQVYKHKERRKTLWCRSCLVLTRGTHGGCGRGTTVDIEPQWLRGSWWQGLDYSTWGSREGSRGGLSLWGCQGCAERGAGLWCLSTCQSCQSPSANLRRTHQQRHILTGGHWITQPSKKEACVITNIVK